MTESLEPADAPAVHSPVLPWRWTRSRWLALALLASSLGWTWARTPRFPSPSSDEDLWTKGCGDFISTREYPGTRWARLLDDFEDQGFDLPLDLGFARPPLSGVCQALVTMLFLALWLRDPLLYPVRTAGHLDPIRRRLRRAGLLLIFLALA